MPTVTFLPGYQKAVVPEGTTILEAALAAGLPMNVVCGGQGKCGKCIVFVKDGTASFDLERYRRFLSDDEIARGACLACRTTVGGDLRVEVPAGSLIQKQKILVEIPGTEEVPFDPSVWKYETYLAPRPWTTPPLTSPACSRGSRTVGARPRTGSTRLSRSSATSRRCSAGAGGT